MTDSEICRVEAVHSTDQGILVDAQHLSRPAIVYRNTPILANFSGLIAVPTVGQKVVVSKDSTDFAYVEGVLTGPNNPAPDLVENEFALQFDPSTKISAEKDGSGGYDLTIEASGDVYLGENGEPVARQDHTHEYDDTGDTSDGTAGTTTKNTDPPNESGTNTQIQ